MCNILTVLQIHPDEVEDDGEVMLIWDFNIDRINLSFTASQCSVQAKIPSCVNSIYSMPYLDTNRVNCNCSKSSKQEKVLLSCAAATAASQLRRLSLSHINDDDGLEEGEEEAELEVGLEDLEEEIDLVSDRVNDSGGAELLLFAPENFVCDSGEELFTESFTLKGSSFHDHFQTALRICKQKVINKEPVPVQLSFEPTNRRDENAIVVHASLDDSWKPIGYIPGLKVAKVTQAIKNKEISTMSINSIKYQYIFPIASFKYFATVTITKKGRWMKNMDTYKYNVDI